MSVVTGGGECGPEGASECGGGGVALVVVRGVCGPEGGERGKYGGIGGECGPEEASGVSAVVVEVSAGRRGRAR